MPFAYATNGANKSVRKLLALKQYSEQMAKEHQSPARREWHKGRIEGLKLALAMIRRLERQAAETLEQERRLANVEN